MLTPRPYQKEVIEACNEALTQRQDNPLIVLPTGAGKSLVIALLAHQWLQAYPQFRAMVLAHRKELVSQNAEELRGIDPWLPVGVFSAALRQRDTLQNITFASIDSVAKRANEFPPQDVLFVDEAHRIPVKGEGKYRKFIAEMTSINPRLRVVGLSATPYRMGVGNICHKDHILNHVCYEANVGDLIRDGYLSKLRTIEGEANIALEGVKKSGGDYNLKDLAQRVDKSDVVAQAVAHMVKSVKSTGRQSIIVFCIDIEHCKHVQQELVKYGISAPYITGKTSQGERDSLVEDFKQGRVQWLLSVNVFFEGFNAKRVDCVAMLRPTQSKGLWVQAVGRGLRLHPGKEFCLVLDYGGNIDRHGPIDIAIDDPVQLATCQSCGNKFSRAVRKCPSCGWEIPPQEQREFAASEERKRTLHEAIASSGSLLNEPRWLDVTGATIRLHRKQGKPDSLRIDYKCGISSISEWVTLDHEGYAGTKAQRWLKERGFEAESVAEFMRKYTGLDVANRTAKILVSYDGKYARVGAYDLRD